MDNFRVRQGASLNLTVTATDAESATLTLRGQETDEVVTKTANFVDGVADISLEPEDTAVQDVYDYMVTIVYDSGSVAKLPEADCGDENCTFPTVTVCEALDVIEVS